MNGKGDKRRKQIVSDKEMQANWERIFNKRANKESKKFNQSIE